VTHGIPARLSARDIGYRIGNREVLSSVTLELGDGDLVALLGANGAGKTTLLRILLGLQKPSAGIVYLEQRPLSTYRRKAIGQRIAYVPQGHVPVFPYLTRQIVELGRLPDSVTGRAVTPDDRRLAVAAMERLSIGHLADRPYTQLSGGERQSVLIARALAQGAQTLILDEPATGLDFGQQLRLTAVLRSLADDGYCIMATTHDPIRARTAFDRAIMLHRGQILIDGPTNEVINEAAIRKLYDIGVGQVLPGILSQP